MTHESAAYHDVNRQLGTLAMRFRRTRDESARRVIAEEYAQQVELLIASGGWAVAPSLEDLLPDEWMPAAFFAYWSPG